MSKNALDYPDNAFQTRMKLLSRLTVDGKVVGGGGLWDTLYYKWCPT